MTLILKSIFFAVMITLISFPTESLGGDLNTQYFRSIDLLMQNMIRQDTAPGAVIAATSKDRPDYFYHWVRDAALVMEAALDLYQSGQISSFQKQNLQKFFLNHILFTQRTQQNASVTAGLGEPKFFVDGRVYTGPWGRPQNDGPALRVSAFVRLLAIAIRENWPQIEEMKKILYQAKLPANSMIKADLEYTALRWHDLNIDLWEEVYGLHFYTLMTQRKALFMGAQIAQAFADPYAAQYYQQQFQKVNLELNRFWDSNRGYILATLSGKSLPKAIKTFNKSQLDFAVILAVLHTDLGKGTFTFTDDRVLSSFQKLTDSFTSIYPINQNKEVASALGRYPEDTYDGYQTNGVGNPWVLSTAGASEYLYRLALQLTQQPFVKITTSNQNFYINTARLQNVSVGKVLMRGSNEYKLMLKNIMAEADRYLARVLLHANPNGSLSEQINRQSGIMQGAPNLSWSYASLITAKLARDRAYSNGKLRIVSGPQ